MYAMYLRDNTTHNGCLGCVQSLHRSRETAGRAVDRRQRQIARDTPAGDHYLPLGVQRLKRGARCKPGQWLRAADCELGEY